MFRATPILQTIARHIEYVAQAVGWNDEVTNALPVGAIVLATTAVRQLIYSLLHNDDNYKSSRFDVHIHYWHSTMTT